MIDHSELEEKCGIRFTYDSIPYKNDIFKEINTPLVMINTPFKLIPIKIINKKICKCNCGGILNPYCLINYDYYCWTCNFCFNKNKFPSEYKFDLKNNKDPIETKEKNFCIEYIKDVQNINKLNLCIIIDRCVNKLELEEIKKGIINLIPNLAKNLKIFLITFDRFVQFYTKRSKIIIYNQISPYLLPIQFLKQLTYYDLNDYEFNLDKKEEKEKLITIIKNIEISNFHVKLNERFETCTGKVFEYILEFKMKFKLDTLRSLFIIGGPCTISDGKFIDLNKSIHPRQKIDFEKNNDLMKITKNSEIYFKNWTKKAVENKVTFDIIGFCLEDYGLYEMSNIVEKTGGFIMFNEEFKKEQFHKGLIQYYSTKISNKYSKFCFNGNYKIMCSENVKINGSLGECHSLETINTDLISKEKLYESKTNIWFVGCCDYSSTILTFFSIGDNKKNKLNKNSNIFFQSIFTYIHPDGTKRIRVITILKNVIKKKQISLYGNLIDSISLIVVYIKMIADKTKTFESEICTRWLDKNLLILLKKLSDNGKILNNLNLLPQFFYYLRKSKILKQISISIDEICFFRTLLLREESSNVLLMIQPLLFEYNTENEKCDGIQIFADINALKKDVVLLMDNYINVIIWKGDSIINWEKEGYFKKKDYEYLNNLNKNPQKYLFDCIKDRIFYPEIFYSYKDAPNERILKFKINPDIKKIENTNEENVLLTDENSFSQFLNKILEIIKN